MSTPHSSTFQSIVLRLQQFWAEQGCVIWQPYHTEVGAGTMNPATALRVLGPEPWNVAYVEPSIRPADGRYGENPNRWQHFYQLQVILKPDPGNPQEVYLQSLIALGLDPKRHDIRFVEDNWEAPAIGAWGLGWEVWLDGQEITQYTYFQQAGGKVLDPVSVEITYGLERIAIALQDVENFLDIHWVGERTYGDLYQQSEIEFSRYNFDVADTERMRQLFDRYEAEAQLSLDAGLIFPAHDYVLKCSHAFNVLDSRGVIGVTERAALFGRMRELFTQVADGYLAQREAEGYPWGDAPAVSPAVEAPGPVKAPARAVPFLLEIGTEELPHGDLQAAMDQLHALFVELLEDERLEHDGFQVLGTPRRLVVWVDDLAPAQKEQVTIQRGPPADRAFDPEGTPTAAAEGFARSQGLSVEALKVEARDGGRYVVAEVRAPGRPAAEVLQEQLPKLLGALTFNRSMRWNASNVPFSRPVRWLLALHGETVIPFSFAGVASGRTTRGLRFEEPDSWAVQAPIEYKRSLEAQGILLDVAARRTTIREQVGALAAEVDGEVIEDEALLDEVAGLVEAPVALRGEFDESFLSLPRPVLIAVMKKHQRYFPVEREGALLPAFIALANGAGKDMQVVRAGNEQVLRARFSDATYFVQRDMEQPLEAYVADLAKITFQSELGSMLDKSVRLEQLVLELAESLGLQPGQREAARRAAQLSKADLATRMVVEMTALQGEMGRLYATHSGEAKEVAEAIFEHYLPRWAGGRLPEGALGFALGVADRLDTLAGLFAVGLQPTGSSDPFGLRRAAIGLIQLLRDRQLRFDLREGLAQAAAGLPVVAEPESLAACLEFIVSRQQSLLAPQHRHDVIEAVLSEQGHDPAGAFQAVEALERQVLREDWPKVLQAYARCARITRGLAERHPLPEQLNEPAEKTLLAAVTRAAALERQRGSIEEFLAAFAPLVDPITVFFDDVLVMAEDPEVRTARLGLLQHIVALADGVADFSKLEGF